MVYLSHADARPIVEALADILPPSLRAIAPAERGVRWAEWAQQRDQEIRARLAQGDEDSVVNLLLFGTSFTRRPRTTVNDLAPSEAPGALIAARAEDLVGALAAPGANERLAFARQVILQKGYDLGTPAGQQGAREFLRKSVLRVIREQVSHRQTLEAARQLGNPTEEFAERSKLYRERGLSLDTSLLPNLAIEKALARLKEQGLLHPSSVRRVAVIGPGLDFVDKQGGFDFYPEQTIQPFALMDSLLRLGLAARDLEVASLDISPRVNAHLRRAGERARRGIGYTIQLPRDTRWRWKPECVRYWQRFGQQIGVPARPAALPASARTLEIRAVRVRPGRVAQVVPLDLNVVLQHVAGEPATGFDLVLATNVFVYYDTFEQSLALANVERMLRPGGLLLSNNVLLELPGSRVRSVDYLTVVYSDRPDDGDHIVWYRKEP